MAKLICEKFCAFYKPGKKEELKCGAYEFLVANYAHGEIEAAAGKAAREPLFSQDAEIMERVCRQCDFLVDGCDYRDGIGRTPCGGYTVAERLLMDKKGD